jgi:D-alanine-D-alanine ligase-like ATP-grasp enzyme
MNSEIAKCKLPMNISQKVIKLFKSLNLNIGTFDFIVNEKNEYYFLEINPSGRFSKIVDEVDSDIYMDIANYLR